MSLSVVMNVQVLCVLKKKKSEALPFFLLSTRECTSFSPGSLLKAYVVFWRLGASGSGVWLQVIEGLGGRTVT